MAKCAGSTFAWPALIPLKPCVLGVWTTSPCPDKNPGSSLWLHQADRLAKCYYQCQMSCSFSICHHYHSCSLILLLSAFIIHHSLKVSLLHSQEWHFLSCLYLTPLTPLSLSVSSDSTFRGAQRHICQGHVLPSSVTMSVPISLRGRQMLDIKHFFCTVFQKSRETERVPETELNNDDDDDGEDSLSLRLYPQ